MSPVPVGNGLLGSWKHAREAGNGNSTRTNACNHHLIKFAASHESGRESSPTARFRFCVWQPVLRGHYRPSNRSTDVRRCPDASANCTDSAACQHSTSGCKGTINGGSSPCYSELDGLFCLLCRPRADGQLVYYQAATNSRRATCETCEGTLGRTVGVWLAIAAACLLILLGARHWYAQHVDRVHKEWVLRAWQRLSVQAKIKLFIGGAMISTTIPTVYEVSFPPAVRKMLHIFSFTITIGLADITTPLACLGWAGYRARLIFFMVFPLLIALGIALTTAAHELIKVLRAERLEPTARDIRGLPRELRSATAKLSSQVLVQACTPWLLRLLFLWYPLVSTVAFVRAPPSRIPPSP